jgi:hypothetical protein
MTASDTIPSEGHESDGASGGEQSVLREIVRFQLERYADELHSRRDADLPERLAKVRRVRDKLEVTETLLEQYVEEDGQELAEVENEL